ncbi:MAG: response regulator transcription factor [Fusobacteria bacterium]|nr:response regulator transcription factor [Fusobacteriota bacterium]
MQKKILIVEDDDRIREVTRDFLKMNGFFVDVAIDGEEAINKVYDGKYDLVLLDLMLPKVDGWEVCKEVKSQLDIPVIMATAKSQESDEIMGFELGADDYLKKPYSLKVLLARIRKLLQMDLESSKIITFGNVKINLNTYTVDVAGAEEPLTPKELELLVLLYKNKNSVLTREKLLNNVWGLLSESDYRTIDTHVKKLRKKIGSEAIKTIRGIGYMLEVKE